MSVTYDAGIATSYAAAVAGGYTGTKEQYYAEQAQFAINAQRVAQDKAAVEQITTTFNTVTAPKAIQDVTDEGNTQVQRVKNKGDEYLEDIDTRVETAVEGFKDDVSDLKDALNDTNEHLADIYQNDIVLTEADFTLNGLLDSDGAFTADSVSGHWCTDFVSVEAGKTYTFTVTYRDSTSTTPRKAFIYDASKQKLSAFATGDSNMTFTVPSNGAYVRINVNSEDFTCSLYVTGSDYSGLKKTLFDNTFTQEYKIPSAKAVGDALPSYVASSSVINPSDFTMNGLIDTSGVYTADSVAGHLCTDFMRIPKGVYYILDFSINGTPTYPRRACVYDKNKNFVRLFGNNSSSMFLILADDETYVRFNINTTDPYEIYLYPIYLNKTGNKKLYDSTIVPQLSRVNTSTLIRHRHPIVSFTLDGDYDMNDDFVALFEKYGINLGLAIGYNEIGNNNDIDTYLDWCNNRGHEMIAYSVTPLPEDSTKTLAEADAIIRTAYIQLKARGFDIYGFVGATGVVAERYRPSVKKIFEYASTKANHSASQESCLFFADDDPCETWRYSMQLSTLAQMKAAVDRCESENGLLQFYTHAESENIMNSTLENVETLIQYIQSKHIDIMTPHEAFADYYTIRREDIV